MCRLSAGPQLTNDRRRHPFAGRGSVATRSELMKTLWILAAAATFAACHNRSDEETGAAPDRGDTTAVSGYDTTAANPNAKVDTTTTTQPTAPSADTSAVVQPDDAERRYSAAPQPTTPSAGYDTTAASQPTAPSAGYDTTSTAVPPTTTDTTMSNPSAGAVDTTMSHDSSSTQR